MKLTKRLSKATKHDNEIGLIVGSGKKISSMKSIADLTVLQEDIGYAISKLLEIFDETEALSRLAKHKLYSKVCSRQSTIISFS